MEKILWKREWQPTPIFLPGEFPWTEEPGGLQSMGSQRVGHDSVTKHKTQQHNDSKTWIFLQLWCWLAAEVHITHPPAHPPANISHKNKHHCLVVNISRLVHLDCLPCDVCYAVLYLVSQSCPTLCNYMNCSLPSSSVHQDKKTEMVCHTLLQGIFLTQELNWDILHRRQILYQLSYQGSPVTH